MKKMFECFCCGKVASKDSPSTWEVQKGSKKFWYCSSECADRVHGKPIQ